MGTSFPNISRAVAISSFVRVPNSNFLPAHEINKHPLTFGSFPNLLRASLIDFREPSIIVSLV